MKLKTTFSLALPLTVGVAFLATRAFAAFSTCRDRGYTTTPTEYCADPRLGAATCAASECEGNRVWNGSTCGWSPNCCAGCNNGATITYYQEYAGACTWSPAPWPFTSACSCSPLYLPTTFGVPVPECYNYNACIGF